MRKAISVLAALLMLLPCANAGAITISLVGDCTIGTIRYKESATDFINTMEKNGMEYPFSNFAQMFQEDDLTIANCEGVFTTRKTPADKAKLSLYAAPEWAQVFALGGVDVVNIANNHTSDFGKPGRESTLEALDAANIVHFGNGELATMTVKDVKIGFTGYSYPHGNNLKKIKANIKTLRDDGCDLVVVSMHWGREENYKLTKEQADYGPMLLKAGADIIFGHGPHVLHRIDIIDGKPLLYSLANFTFGGNRKPKDPDTVAISLEYEWEGDELKLQSLTAIPARMHDNGDFRPYAYQEQEDIDRVLKKLGLESTTLIP